MAITKKTLVTEIKSAHDFQMHPEIDDRQTVINQIAIALYPPGFTEITEGVTIGLDKVRIRILILDCRRYNCQFLYTN